MQVNVDYPAVLDSDNVLSDSTPIAAADIEATFGSSTIDLASATLGSKILSVSDEWFAEASNLTNPRAPIHKPATFTFTGQWYDGWETRRHNPQPFDWVVIRLGVASGTVKGVEIDTGFFSGNHAPEVAVEGCFSTDDAAVAQADFSSWETILAKKECGPACRQAWLLTNPSNKAYTHVRLCMFPDGGIGRFRLYGSAVPVFPTEKDAILDLAAAVNGGVATACSDQHFGTRANLLLPGRGVDMGDGWETKRSRGVHIDWTTVRLGAAGYIEKVVVDTAHFRGNFPQKVQVFAAAERAHGQPDPDANDHDAWTQILAPQKTGPDQEHEFDGASLVDVQGKVYRFVKLVIIPDGGVKRLRVFGRRP